MILNYDRTVHSSRRSVREDATLTVARVPGFRRCVGVKIVTGEVRGEIWPSWWSIGPCASSFIPIGTNRDSGRRNKTVVSLKEIPASRRCRMQTYRPLEYGSMVTDVSKARCVGPAEDGRMAHRPPGKIQMEKRIAVMVNSTSELRALVILMMKELQCSTATTDVHELAAHRRSPRRPSDYLALAVGYSSFPALSQWSTRMAHYRQFIAPSIEPPMAASCRMEVNIWYVSLQLAAAADFKWCLGNLLHIHGLGNNILVLNDIMAVNDLLDKRGAIYSHRPTFTVVGELMGLGKVIIYSVSNITRINAFDRVCPSARTTAFGSCSER